MEGLSQERRKADSRKEENQSSVNHRALHCCKNWNTVSWRDFLRNHTEISQQGLSGKLEIEPLVPNFLSL